MSYLYVSQRVDDVSPLFRGHAKRPDFLVLLESVGLIAVDVKNCKLFKGDGGSDYLTLEHENEVRKVLTFERIFRMPVWYAYYTENDGEVFWRWISALKVLEKGKLVKNGDRKAFHKIDLRHFEEVRVNEDLGKLYTHRLKSLKEISKAPN